jgi:hypothetical protein
MDPEPDADRFAAAKSYAEAAMQAIRDSESVAVPVVTVPNADGDRTAVVAPIHYPHALADAAWAFDYADGLALADRLGHSAAPKVYAFAHGYAVATAIHRQQH